ncbi:hypothetical protein HDIA_2838 [Hartmannibacter diazotrophicus]|uniref:DUF2059 domain-containing protein n=1 Tax=Hartmannibacter diazotrophicus TaxID=1482074 RepID=A0A2C9D869_9HYPH|nr:DUF2059 domain-containing protein [Hartmannibacter diazotrophicus]SON56379.1 hypothetical protein HDIA_2838 [Hartmannibacter diazotrophicus]
MKTFKIFGSAAAFLLAASLMTLPAAAEDFTPEHLAAAQKAIQAAHASETFDQILPVLADQTKSLFQRSNPAAIKDIDEVVDSVALNLAKRRPELQAELQRVWAARLSIEELQTVTAFYESPTGKKFGELMPAILQDSVRVAGVWRDALSSEIVTKSREELKKRGYNF